MSKNKDLKITKIFKLNQTNSHKYSRIIKNSKQNKNLLDLYFTKCLELCYLSRFQIKRRVFITHLSYVFSIFICNLIFNLLRFFHIFEILRT